MKVQLKSNNKNELLMGGGAAFSLITLGFVIGHLIKYVVLHVAIQKVELHEI